MFAQNTIALIWDFDKTLIPGYMQQPLFDKFGIDASVFWREVNQLPEFYRRQGVHNVSKDTVYLNHILTYARSQRFQGLNNRMLKELGGSLEFYPGLPEFFKVLKDMVAANKDYVKNEISVEHYIVSTGLRQMILGSKIANYVDGIWACEFVERTAQPGYLGELALDANQQLPLFTGDELISEIAYVIDNTTKTRAVFEINKGSNVRSEIDVNSVMKHEDRRIPFQNMIYIADGPSDVPVFSCLLNN